MWHNLERQHSTLCWNLSCATVVDVLAMGQGFGCKQSPEWTLPHVQEGGAGGLAGGVELLNKPPHWNESLHCWCLNFRGRVKLASVKNFQLIAAGDPDKAIVMQARARAAWYIIAMRIWLAPAGMHSSEF